jgi:prevent-host-death family protein
MESNPVRTLSATEAKNRFGAVLREVSRSGGPIIVERGGKAVAVILSMRAYKESHRDLQTSVASQAELARAAFGMWANRQDIDDEWLERGRQQWYSEWPDD